MMGLETLFIKRLFQNVNLFMTKHDKSFIPSATHILILEFLQKRVTKTNILGLTG